NGAGKTTCFNLLTHFLTPTAGRIMFNGRDITGSRPADIARLGLVRSFQISAVFPHLTVLENVSIALQRRRGASFDFWRSERAVRCWPRAIIRPSRAIPTSSRPTWGARMPEPLLAVRDLHAWYGESHILHGVAFDVRPGEVVTLLGRNGAGKSTTLKTIMGIV